MPPLDLDLITLISDYVAVSTSYIPAVYAHSLARLVASGHLRRVPNTVLGTCITLGEINQDDDLPHYDPCPVHSAGSVANVAALAMTRVNLEAEGLTFDRMIFKKVGFYKDPYLVPHTRDRRGIPIGLIMRLSQQILQDQHGHRLADRQNDNPSLGECPVYASISGGGLTPARVQQLLKRHGTLERNSGTLILGVRDPEPFRMLDQALNAPHRAVQHRCQRAGGLTPAQLPTHSFLAPVLRAVQLQIPNRIQRLTARAAARP